MQIFLTENDSTASLSNQTLFVKHISYSGVYRKV